MSYLPGTRPRTPYIYNKTMTSADTEYSQALPRGALTFLIHTRDETIFRLSFETGKVATPTAPYLTILANSGYSEFEIVNEDESLTIYFASPSAGKVVELLVWT